MSDYYSSQEQNSQALPPFLGDNLFPDAGQSPAQHAFDEYHTWTSPSQNAHPYHTSLRRITTASDHASDVHSQSESQSQTPGGSNTSRRQQLSNDNLGRKKPTSLSYYRSTEMYAPLAEAKESFAATAFASGCFFYHQRSPYVETFQTYAHDAIAHAANTFNTQVHIDKNIMTLVYNTLGSRRSTLKKEARLIVEKQYSLLNVDGEDNIALKVQGLLDDAGPTNMAFTDGPSDLNGNPGRWNHPCCQEIISKFLFDNSNSLGQKFTARFGPPLTTEIIAFGHTMAYICLEEWVTGTQISKDLNVVEDETKYNSIFAGLRAAENDPYAGPLLNAMYRDWWDRVVKTNSPEAAVKRNVIFRKTYGPPLPSPLHPASYPSHHAQETNSSMAKDGSIHSWDMLLESESFHDIASTSSNLLPTLALATHQQYSFSPISESLPNADSSQPASTWVSNEPYYTGPYDSWPTLQ